MAYSETLANRIRECLAETKHVAEKEMFGGLAFMINNKMCVGVIKDEMMCRVNPELHETCTEKTGCRTMDFTGRPMKGWLIVDDSGMRNKKELTQWVSLALDFNSEAKQAKPKKKK